MYLNYIEEDLLKHKNPQGIMVKEMVVEALDQPVYNVFTERLDVTSSNIFSQSKAVLFEGQRYNKDEVVVHEVAAKYTGKHLCRSLKLQLY